MSAFGSLINLLVGATSNEVETQGVPAGTKENKTSKRKKRVKKNSNTSATQNPPSPESLNSNTSNVESESMGGGNMFDDSAACIENESDDVGVDSNSNVSTSASSTHTNLDPVKLATAPSGSVSNAVSSNYTSNHMDDPINMCIAEIQSRLSVIKDAGLALYAEKSASSGVGGLTIAVNCKTPAQVIAENTWSADIIKQYIGEMYDLGLQYDDVDAIMKHIRKHYNPACGVGAGGISSNVSSPVNGTDSSSACVSPTNACVRVSPTYPGLVPSKSKSQIKTDKKSKKTGQQSESHAQSPEHLTAIQIFEFLQASKEGESTMNVTQRIQSLVSNYLSRPGFDMGQLGEVISGLCSWACTATIEDRLQFFHTSAIELILYILLTQSEALRGASLLDEILNGFAILLGHILAPHRGHSACAAEDASDLRKSIESYICIDVKKSLLNCSDIATAGAKHSKQRDNSIYVVLCNVLSKSIRALYDSVVPGLVGQKLESKMHENQARLDQLQKELKAIEHLTESNNVGGGSALLNLDMKTKFHCRELIYSYMSTNIELLAFSANGGNAASANVKNANEIMNAEEQKELKQLLYKACSVGNSVAHNNNSAAVEVVGASNDSKKGSHGKKSPKHGNVTEQLNKKLQHIEDLSKKFKNNETKLIQFTAQLNALQLQIVDIQRNISSLSEEQVVLEKSMNATTLEVEQLKSSNSAVLIQEKAQGLERKYEQEVCDSIQLLLEELSEMSDSICNNIACKTPSAKDGGSQATPACNYEVEAQRSQGNISTHLNTYIQYEAACIFALLARSNGLSAKVPALLVELVEYKSLNMDSMCTHINQSLDTICSNINEDISIVNTIQKCLVDTLSKANPAGLNEVSFVDTLPHMLLLDVLNSIETFDKTYEQAGVNYQPGIVPLELHPQLLELCANIKKNGVYLKAKINAAKVSSSKKLDPVNEESNSAATSAVQGSTSSSVSPSNKRSKNKANNKKAEPRVNHNSTDLSPDVLANTIKNIHIDVVADPETTAAPAPSKSSNNHPKKASPKKHVVIMIPEDQLGGHGIGSAGSSGISTTPTDGVLIRLGSDDDELPLPKRTGRKSSANTVPSNTSSDVQSKGKQLAPVAATVPAAGTISEMKVTASAPKPKSNLAQPITNKSSPSSSGAGVCFAYQRNGVCHKGDSCKFSHVPNDDSKPHPDTHTGSNSTAKHRNPTCVITNIHLDSDSVKMGTTGASTVNTASVIASNSRKTTYVSGNTSILGEIGCVTTDSNPSVRKTRTALKTDVTIKTTRGLVPRPNMGPNINAATIPEAQPASTWKGWIKPQ